MKMKCYLVLVIENKVSRKTRENHNFAIKSNDGFVISFSFNFQLEKLAQYNLLLVAKGVLEAIISKPSHNNNRKIYINNKDKSSIKAKLSLHSH